MTAATATATKYQLGERVLYMGRVWVIKEISERRTLHRHRQTMYLLSTPYTFSARRIRRLSYTFQPASKLRKAPSRDD